MRVGALLDIMLPISSALQTHLQSSIVTIAYLITLTRRDGVNLNFTNHNRDIVINEVVFRAEAGFSPSAVEGDATGSPQNLELSSYLSKIDSNLISADDILAGKYRGCTLTLRMVNYTNLPTALPSDDAPILMKAWLGEVTLQGEDAFQFEVLSLSNLLQQNIGYNVQDYCQANLGDGNCRKDLTDYTYLTTITAVNSTNQTVNIDLSPIVSASTPVPVPDQWFKIGKIQWLSGQNQGAVMEIVNQEGDELILALPLYYPIEAGDSVRVVAGCMKRIKEDCTAKFSNTANYFAGFPHLPGQNKVSQGMNTERSGGKK